MLSLSGILYSNVLYLCFIRNYYVTMVTLSVNMHLKNLNWRHTIMLSLFNHPLASIMYMFRYKLVFVFYLHYLNQCTDVKIQPHLDASVEELV